MNTKRLISRASSLIALPLLLVACESVKIGNPASNVLKRVNPSVDAVNGYWEMVDGKLQSEATQHARIALPVVPHGDYQLTVRFARLVGTGSAHFILPVGNQSVMLVVAGWPEEGTYSGLEYVDGRRSRDNITTDDQFDLVNNRVYRLEATVRTQGTNARVDVDIDGRPFVRWMGPQSALSLPIEWDLGAGAALGVGSYDSVVQVHSAQLRMLPGEMVWFK